MNFVEQACDLTEEFYDGVTMLKVLDQYKDLFFDSRLMTVVSNDLLAGTGNFNFKFIRDHEHYITITTESTDTASVRVCHNLDSTGGGNEEVYMFIHGLGGSIEQFLPLLKLLKVAGKSFVAVDLPGFGKSTFDKDLTIDNYSMINIVTMLKKDIMSRYLSGSTELTIVGHSMGCYLSLHYYKLFQSESKIKNIILLSPPNPEETRLSKANYKTRFFINLVFNRSWLFDFYRKRFDQSKGLYSSGIKGFFHNISYDLTSENNPMIYLRLVQFSNNIQIKSKSIMGYLYGWEPIDWEGLRSIIDKDNLLKKIVCICGKDDKITPTKYSQEIVDRLASSMSTGLDLILIENCAHNICFDNPNAVTKTFYENVLKK